MFLSRRFSIEIEYDLDVLEVSNIQSSKSISIYLMTNNRLHI